MINLIDIYCLFNRARGTGHHFNFFLFLLTVKWSLPPGGMGEVCAHPNLPRPHLWDYTGYVCVLSSKSSTQKPVTLVS